MTLQKIHTIIDQCSKFRWTYILNSKKAETILPHLKDFIIKNGEQQKII